MQQALQKYSLFTWLLPVFFVLHGCNDNEGLIPVKDATILALFYLGLTAITTLFSRLILKNFSKACLFTFAIISIYFFFGPIHDLLKKISVNGLISKYSFVLPAISLLLLSIFISLKKQKKNNHTLILYLNILMFSLIILDTGRLINNFISVNENINERTIQLNPCDDCAKPDIYLIIADEYSGNRSLSEFFQFDNSVFSNELSKRGFRVITNSSANYNATAYTMASMLNLNYINGLNDTVDSKENISRCYSLIKKNQTLQFFKEHGYRFFNYSSFEFYDEPAYTTQGFLPGKTAPITNQTLSGRIIRDLWFHLVTDLNWKSAINAVTYLQLKKNNKTYDQTMKAAEEYKEKPKFIYSHFIMPHNPYYYTRTGQLRKPEELTKAFRNDKKGYADYIQYVNKKLLELIDHIRSESVSEPVIFLAGDHGFRHYEPGVPTLYQFDNFSAISLPERKYDQFYDSMTLVNQMRAVLNTQFKQKLPVLKDSLIYIRQ
jgi:hypothetical protein